MERCEIVMKFLLLEKKEKKELKKET